MLEEGAPLIHADQICHDWTEVEYKHTMLLQAQLSRKQASALREAEDINKSQLAAILHALSELEAENLEMRSSFERVQEQVITLERHKRELEEQLKISRHEVHMLKV